MDTDQKIELMGRFAQFDLCGNCTPRAAESHRRRGAFGRWIYPAVLPDGKTVRLLKLLLTNQCRNDCTYCVNRCSRDIVRSGFEPAELAELFSALWTNGLVQGFFLSSGIQKNPDHTMERMIRTVEIVRKKYGFRGYVHLKVLPGASFEAIEHAMRVATRVSVNLESPGPDRLAHIAPGKDFHNDLVQRMHWVKTLLERGDTGCLDHTTQFVVGAAEESDSEILNLTDRLYRRVKLKRAYYSAFQPLEEEARDGRRPTPTLREHRLYQADYLLRRYGFTFDELTFDARGNLPFAMDPKRLWAIKHPETFPVEINTATRQQLLRVPGIGPRSATRIVTSRAKDKFHTVEELEGTGAVVRWAAPYVLISGKRVGELKEPGQQMLDLGL
jgi:putative DNA modification/repair radical SAM protein